MSSTPFYFRWISLHTSPLRGGGGGGGFGGGLGAGGRPPKKKKKKKKKRLTPFKPSKQHEAKFGFKFIVL